jgi:hypothetical protein
MECISAVHPGGDEILVDIPHDPAPLCLLGRMLAMGDLDEVEVGVGHLSVSPWFV